MARKKKEKKKAEESEEVQEGKKGKKGKKKLLFIPIVLILLAAAAFVVVRFVLPGLNAEPGPGEEKPPKNLEAYTIGEAAAGEDGEELPLDTVFSLDTILEEGEGRLIAAQKPEKEKPKEDASSSSSSSEQLPLVEQYIYVYDITTPAAVVDRYLDAVLGGEEKFVLVDETCLPLEERPVLEDTLGALTLVRPSVQEGHLFQMVIGWSEASILTVRVSAPEGAIRKPDKKEPGLGAEVIETIPLTAQIEKIQNMDPSRLGFDGESMADYEIYPVEGFVKVDDLDCRRFNIYVRRPSGEGHYPDLEGIILLSADQEHIFRLDPESNAVTELR